MPLPNHPVIHPRWEAHHRPVTQRAMPAECKVLRPSSEPVWDDEAGRNTYPESAHVYGPGPCRITRPAGAGAPVVADRQVTLVDYIVALPADAPKVQVGDLVTFTRIDGDPWLAGETLRVEELLGGSLTWQRDLRCRHQPATTR